MSTSRFENGVTNNKPGSPLGDMGQLDPTLFLSYFNDFTTYNSGDWTKTATGAATAALESGFGGLLLMTNTANNNDIVSLQQAIAAFAVQSGLDFWMVMQFALADATNTALIMGLAEIDTTPFTAITDGFYFQKASGSTALNFYATESSTPTEVAGVAQMANNTMISVGMYVNQLKQRIKLWVNNQQVPGIYKTTYPTLTTANLALIMAIQNGAAAAKTLVVDYVGAFFVRPEINDPSYAGVLARMIGNQMGNLVG